MQTLHWAYRRIQGKDTSFSQKIKNILSSGLCKTAQTEKNIIKMQQKVWFPPLQNEIKRLTLRMD